MTEINRLIDEKPENPAAFPLPGTEQSHFNQSPLPAQEGMTLRDYFAAAALQGECSAQDDVSMGVAVKDEDFVNQAIRCYKYADAMLKVRTL